MPGFYENAGDPGNQFGLAAEASATEAKHWANYTPGVEVPEDGTEFSAKHYADASSTSATNANASKVAAAASASAASSSETNAAASAAAAALALDNFDDIYLGAKASDPTVDNDGDTLADGALYYDTTLNIVKVYDLGTTTWSAASSYAHPNHSGDVVSVSDGATTIQAGVVDTGKLADASVSTAKLIDSSVTTAKILDSNVTNAKLDDVPTNRIKGRATAGTGAVEDLTATQVRSIINVENGATADQTKADIDALGIDAATLDSLDSTDFLRVDNTGDKSVEGNPYLTQDTLTDGATITWTCTNGTEAFVTLGGNRTLALNAVPPAGTWLTLLARQDGTGSRTLAYNATYFTFGDAGTPVLSTIANSYDVLSFRSNGTRAQFIGIAQGFTA